MQFRTSNLFIGFTLAILAFSVHADPPQAPPERFAKNSVWEGTLNQQGLFHGRDVTMELNVVMTVTALDKDSFTATLDENDGASLTMSYSIRGKVKGRAITFENIRQLGGNASPVLGVDYQGSFEDTLLGGTALKGTFASPKQSEDTDLTGYLSLVFMRQQT